MNLTVLFINFLPFVLPIIHCTNYVSDISNRTLYVATFQNYHKWIQGNGAMVWKLSGSALSSSKSVIEMKILGENVNWKEFEFLTKPMYYLDFVKNAISNELKSGRDPLNSYCVLVDSDTFWSLSDPAVLWHRFDCARNNKQIVVSSESNCWIGRYCTKEDVSYLYSDIKVKGYNMFINSGAIMGRLEEISLMLSNVTTSQHLYHIFNGKKTKFDDQYAIALYAKDNRNVVEIDYHQVLFGNYPLIRGSEEGAEKHNPFVCKNDSSVDSPVVDTCRNYVHQIAQYSVYKFDYETCRVTRHTDKIPQHSLLRDVVATVSSDPCLWHGNGFGKQIYISHLKDLITCLPHKYGNISRGSN